MHSTFCSHPHSQHSRLAYEKGPSDCGILAVKQHTGPCVLNPAGHRPRMLHAAFKCGLPAALASPPSVTPHTGWPSSTPKSDPLGATKAVFPLRAGHGCGSWSPHSQHQNQMPSHPSSLCSRPPAPGSCDTEHPTTPPLVQRPELSGSSPGQCRFAQGYQPASGPQTESFHLLLHHKRTCLV